MRTKFLECAACHKEVQLNEDFQDVVLESERCAYCEDFFCCGECFDKHECYGHQKAA